MLRYLFPLLLIYAHSAAQVEAIGNLEHDVLLKRIDSLKLQQEHHNLESDRLGNEVSKLVRQKLAREKQTLFAKGVPLYCREVVKVYAERGTWTDVVGIIPKGTTIMAYDYKNNYYFVAFDTLNGYVLGINAETLDSRDRKLEIQRKDAMARETQAEKTSKEQLERSKTLTSKFGSVNGNKILQGKIWLGMSKEMTQESWGKPRDINRSVGSWGIREQWVYSNAYLYFVNDVLGSWQD